MVIRSGDTPSPGERAALDRALNAAGGSGSGGGRVYMGSRPKYSSARLNLMSESAARRAAPHKADMWATEDEAYNDFFTWTKKQRRDFITTGIVAGRLALDSGDEEGAAEWKKLVKLSARFGAAGQKVSPMDLMASYMQAAKDNAKDTWKQMGAFEVNGLGQKRYAGPGTYLGGGKAQQTDTRVDFTDPDTAKAIATKLFQDMMGRDPGPGELGAFGSALHTAEQASPVVQTTTTQYNMETGQPITSSTQSSGGVSAEGKAYVGEQQVKKKKEYGAYQAATTYENALESLVFGGPE